jgi:hypothetical protein
MKNILLIAIILIASKLSAQTDSKSAIIYLYNKTVHAQAAKVVYVNDKEIATVKKKNKLIYKVLEPGTLKITIESGILQRGTLYSMTKIKKNFLIEAGKEYHFIAKQTVMGIDVKIANEKEIAKLKKAKYKETIIK